MLTQAVAASKALATNARRQEHTQPRMQAARQLLEA
jgi:hypothetical protein